MPESTDLAAREQRYILLLEKRIADLEGQLKLDPGKELDTSDVVSATKPLVNGTTGPGDGDSSKEEKKLDADGKSVEGVEKPGDENTKSKDDGNATKPSESKDAKTDGSDDKAKPPLSRVRLVIYRWWEDTASFEDRELSTIKEPEEKKDRAFTFRRCMDDTGKSFQRSEIEIESDALRLMIKKVLDKTYPFLDWDQRVMKFTGPFQHFVYMYDALTEESKEQDDDEATTKQTREDLRELLKMVRECNELSNYFQNRETDIKTGRVAYEYLWTMFAPKTDVFSKRCLGEPMLFTMMDHPSTDYSDDSSFKTEMWCYDWNGTEMVRTFHDVEIAEKYEGYKNVTAMNVYPLRYFKDDSVKDFRSNKKTSENGQVVDSVNGDGEHKSCMTPDELRDMLIDRGLEFYRRCHLEGKQRLFSYSKDSIALASKKGVTGSLSRPSDDARSMQTSAEENNVRPEKPTRQIKVKGPYIADHASFMRYGSSNRIDDGGNTPHFPSHDEPQWFRLCPPRLLGYATKEKTWAQFILSKTDDILEKHTSAFREELQLDQRYKDMLLSLVNMHESQANAKVGDMVEDKGNSLVILLHGPPGVGKSLTAETLADATRKPLLIVSVAEIGLQAEKAERNLETMFTLASAWEAILLVDEADVFLENRTEHADPNRNALVSVLLRVLEYYQGVIILTTNRITSIDIAVQSRIHLAIQYHDLTPSQRNEIFKYFLDQVHFHGTQDKKNVERWFTDYACREELNGRQIRNLVASSQALSASRKKDLDEDSMRTVMALTQEFQRTVRERTMLQRAKNEGINRY
ncbi:MAG: hypothetical protein Q9227_004562 [Pyrenula ochraceoflavens]